MEDGISGNSYHFGGNNQINNFFVAQEICRIIENRIGDGFNYQSLIKYVDDRPGHDKRYSIDSSKIENSTDWKPKYDFDTALKETVNWYLENSQWWEHLIDEKMLHSQPWTLDWSK